MFSNPDVSVVDKDSLALFIKVQIANENVSIEKLNSRMRKK